MINLKQLRALEKAATPAPWTWRGGLTHKEFRANGELSIALRNAAPDLLALLEEALELAKHYADPSRKDVLDEGYRARAFLNHFTTADGDKD